jgi:uncharacterized protein (DUF885 family)
MIDHREPEHARQLTTSPGGGVHRADRSLSCLETLPDLEKLMNSTATLTDHEIFTDICNAVWMYRVERSPYLASQVGAPLKRLPEVSYEAAELRAAFMRDQLTRVSSLNPQILSYRERLVAKTLAWDLARAEEETASWWHEFPVTPYASPLSDTLQILASMPLDRAERREEFWRLTCQVPTLIHEMAVKLHAQESKGIVLPRAELELVIPYLKGLVQPPESSPFRVRIAGSGGISDTELIQLADKVADLIKEAVNPRLAGLLAWLQGDYALRATDRVGLYQYPGGLETYACLIRRYTTMETRAEEVHARGLEAVEIIMGQMASLREKLGFSGTAAEYRQVLRDNPYFYARTPEEVGERLVGFMHRLDPFIPKLFDRLPEAPYAVRRLPPEFEGSVTFGYYEPPTNFDPTGYYYYNGGDLASRPLIYAAGLIFHELAPGHHFQMARQLEDDTLPPVSRYQFHGTYVEGWAEYAAELAGELGLYTEPLDLYGRMAMHLLTAARMVVDSGMNALGWTRAQATQYLQERAMESDSQIATETLRYAVDIPGQALTFKMGNLAFADMRREEQARLGASFDVKRFHEAVLSCGSVPIEVLRWHLRQAAEGPA